MQPLTSTKPYLLRAFYDWITDNNCTPYLIINAECDGVEVPNQYVDDGRIVLNVSPSAVRNLEVNNDAVEFDARFGGVAMTVYAPMIAIMAVYAHENGRGMVFSEEEHLDNDNFSASADVAFAETGNMELPELDADEPTPPTPPKGKGGKPNLRIIK
jgi:stringent starvation protein B